MKDAIVADSCSVLCGNGGGNRPPAVLLLPRPMGRMVTSLAPATTSIAPSGVKPIPPPAVYTPDLERHDVIAM